MDDVKIPGNNALEKQTTADLFKLWTKATERLGQIRDEEKGAQREKDRITTKFQAARSELKRVKAFLDFRQGMDQYEAGGGDEPTLNEVILTR